MSSNQCTRRGPMTRGQCCKTWWGGHTEHHALSTDERWTDADAERIRVERRTEPTGDQLLSVYGSLFADGGGR